MTNTTKPASVADAIRKAQSWIVQPERESERKALLAALGRAEALEALVEASEAMRRSGARAGGEVKRYSVLERIAYGRTIFAVVDNHNSGQRPFVVARCDSRMFADHIAGLLNDAPASE